MGLDGLQSMRLMFVEVVGAEGEYSIEVEIEGG